MVTGTTGLRLPRRQRRRPAWEQVGRTVEGYARADSAAMAAGTEAWMQSRRVGWRDMNQSMITKHGPTMVRALDDALCSASRHGDDVDVYHLMRC